MGVRSTIEKAYPQSGLGRVGEVAIKGALCIVGAYLGRKVAPIELSKALAFSATTVLAVDSFIRTSVADSRRRDLESANQSLSKTCDDRKKEIDDDTNFLEQIRVTMAGLKAELHTEKEAATDSRTRLADVEEQMKTLIGERDQAQSAVGELQKRLQEATTQIAKERSEAHVQRTNIEEQLRRAEARLKGLSEQITAEASEKEQLQAQLKALEQEKASWQAQKDVRAHPSASGRKETKKPEKKSGSHGNKQQIRATIPRGQKRSPSPVPGERRNGT